MTLQQLLTEQRSRIIKKWRETLIATYPEDARRFLSKEKDQFANPVGYRLTTELETLYDTICAGGDPDTVAACLDTIIRVRAVQDFTPSRAVDFIFRLKALLRDAVKNTGEQEAYAAELMHLEDGIDDVARTAFDIYSACRQKLFEIRVKEVKNQVGKLLERAQLTCEIPELKTDL